MTVLLVAGARPNFMKIAPVYAAFAAAGHDVVLVHTGQHYDADMSDAFFHDLHIPRPDYHLEVGSASHAVQTSRVMQSFEPVLLEVEPDWVLVPGDVNSTLACALVAAKLKYDIGCRIAHLESGLRSNDWRMPEEINRVLTDRLSDVLLTPSEDAADNLFAEGIDKARIAFVGNVMIDTLMQRLPAALELRMAARLGVGDADYAVATLHRPSNVDVKDMLEVFLTALADLSKNLPVIVPVHPRTRASIADFGMTRLLDSLTITSPLCYSEMLSLTAGAAAVLTDSGGLQEETTALGVPCVTLRARTERPITVTQGTNRLIPWPPTVPGIIATTRAALSAGRVVPGSRCPNGWDGKAAQRCVGALQGSGTT